MRSFFNSTAGFVFSPSAWPGISATASGFDSDSPSSSDGDYGATPYQLWGNRSPTDFSAILVFARLALCDSFQASYS